ncbi:acyltransferase family protein [Brachybacterium sacelli]|uniref:Fucose 4-O-acetylase-like acetyltransferase n=1 Tax=Brachybacterium sacelli TaxID=173364 RepID=A0ABS4X4Y1_9MICO|nr:acyltransferase [Brachybacterium sacelli]MBP2383518.1 fucose 4-O-acetylase-like acetyltransferase [Brachybacterium sacelli]
MDRSPARPPVRIAWLDLARAISILLVVLYHVAVSAGPELLGGSGSPAARWWTGVNVALIPLRMPLFFLVAGALATRAVQRPWRAVLRPRVLDLLWPYLLWCLLFAVTGWPRYAPADPLGFLAGEVTGMLVIGSPYWFIAVLPLFFVLARPGRRRPAVTVALALAAYLLAPVLQAWMVTAGTDPDLAYGVFQVTDNALWYLLGVVLHGALLRAGDRVRALPGLLTGTALLLVFGMLAAAVLRSEAPLAVVRLLELAASLTGLAAAVRLIPLLARRGALARLGAHLGSRTLVIYLVHPVLLNVGVVLWMRVGADDLITTVARELLLIPVLAALAVLGSLALDRALARWGPGWLLAAPGAGRSRREMPPRGAASGPPVGAGPSAGRSDRPGPSRYRRSHE